MPNSISCLVKLDLTVCVDNDLNQLKLATSSISFVLGLVQKVLRKTYTFAPYLHFYKNPLITEKNHSVVIWVKEIVTPVAYISFGDPILTFATKYNLC